LILLGYFFDKFAREAISGVMIYNSQMHK